MRRTVITISGKAKEVFKLFDLFCKQKGDMRIKELGREK